MKVTITVDGEVVEHDCHDRPSRLKMREIAVAEQAVGISRTHATLLGEHGWNELIRFVLWAQLVGPYGPLDPAVMPLDKFDPTWGDVDWPDIPPDEAEDEAEPAESVVVPMTLPDGTVIEGASGDPDEPVDPTVRETG